MDKIKLSSNGPIVIKEFFLPDTEFCQYLYLPVVMQGTRQLILEERLRYLEPMIMTAISFHEQTLSGAFDHYVYLTIKRTFVPKDIHQNRPGWHSDGFGTDDVQYIWYDKTPTEFMVGDFEVSTDDVQSMLDMEFFAQKIAWFQSGHIKEYSGTFMRPDPYLLLRIDQHDIHRTTPALTSGPRTFIKITISKHIYAQEGNSHNYGIDYDWKLARRDIARNQPHKS